MDKTCKKKGILITHSTNNGKNLKLLYDLIGLFHFIILNFHIFKINKTSYNMSLNNIKLLIYIVTGSDFFC